MLKIDFERFLKEIIKIEIQTENLIPTFLTLEEQARQKLINSFVPLLYEIKIFLEKIKKEMYSDNLLKQAEAYYIGLNFFAIHYEFRESIDEGNPNDRPKYLH